jgi:hypothetical protein
MFQEGENEDKNRKLILIFLMFFNIVICKEVTMP